MKLDTKRWEETHGRKPGGSHLWQFQLEAGAGVNVLVSTDGPFAKTRDRVLKSLSDRFGPNWKVELLP